MSRVTNHINRNIDQNQNSTDADVEVLNINSPDYNTQDFQNHEASLNEAWRFINAAACQNFTQNEGLKRNHRDHDQYNMHEHTPLGYENIHQNSITRRNIKNNTWSKTTRNKNYNRDFDFPTITDYLDTLENSSDEDSPNIYGEKYNNTEAVEIFDGTIYAVGNEGPMLIYSYKSKYNTSENNEVLINSPDQESKSNSTGSTSVENLNEESMRYERNFFTYSTPFHPVIIPRLPLTTYKLPTVTEILEPSRQSPKVIELSGEDNAYIKRKPSNSWVMNEDDNSHSDTGNTTETNTENSANKSPLDDKEQSLHSLNNNTANTHENYSKTNIKVKTENSDTRVFVDVHTTETFDSTAPDDSSRIKYETKFLKQKNNYLDDRDVFQMNSDSKDTEKNSSKSNQSFSSPVELFSKHSSIPTLHLSLNTEIDPQEQSWFKRFLKCILCCK